MRGGLRRGRGRVPLVVRGWPLDVFVMMKNNPRAGMRGWHRALHRSMRHPLHGGRDARIVVEGNERGRGEHVRARIPHGLLSQPIVGHRRDAQRLTNLRTDATTPSSDSTRMGAQRRYRGRRVRSIYTRKDVVGECRSFRAALVAVGRSLVTAVDRIAKTSPAPRKRLPNLKALTQNSHTDPMDTWLQNQIMLYSTFSSVRVFSFGVSPISSRPSGFGG